MKRLFTLLFFTMCLGGISVAQEVKAVWTLSDLSTLSTATVTGEEAYTSLLTTSYQLGSNLTASATMTKSGADTDNDYTAVNYDPAFTQFVPSAQVSSKTSGHSIAVGLTPVNGHKFKPTKISFDVAKCGTDGGGVEVYYKAANASEVKVDAVSPLRNKIMNGNSVGYSHCEYAINDVVVDGNAFIMSIYIMNIATTKSMALRNLTIEGEVDNTTTYTVSSYLSALTFNGKTSAADASQIDLYSAVKGLKNGENLRYTTKLYAAPTDFTATLQQGLAENTEATVNYADNKAVISIKKNGSEVFSCSVTFTVSNAQPKGQAVPLKRGLMAINLAASSGSGNLVSWRARKSDGASYKYKLWRGTNATTQSVKVNSGRFIMGKTNFSDASGTVNSYYKLEVFDNDNNLIETEISGKTWDNQLKYITLEGGAPVDPTTAGATYSPNDASFCDMDGDGEYEIVLKWSPSNETDAASSGTTSPEFYGCYKLDGTKLWLLHTGPNMFSSAHTSPFIAWDLDGDGFGEFMVKTAPGAVDGEGNYVLMDGDDPTANWKNSRGKQVSGPEYITVFDGRNGAELKTIAYHTNYAAGANYWGDSNQNRSERYLAAIAWLDGENANPSAIFARGYYSGAFVGAYDWDGSNLTLRWLHRALSASNGEVKYADGTTTKLTSTVYGEGAHWISVADVNGDGKQEITYGSGAIKPDGTTLYRTGLGHGDALHVSDFDPTRPGLECFMAHEKSPYGVDYRDATTGYIITRQTASGDTGRGFMANFDPEREDALFQSSASASLFDTKGNVVVESQSHGGGAGLQDRIYWTGTLADDFFGKSVLETWNGTSLGRILGCVNGSNYTSGTLNNDSKYNACVLGDILGDWREEIVTWTGDATNGYKLIINATNYTTDYTVPHLMDDYAYRAQVINQNCAYNQPPHLGYNLRESKKVTRKMLEIEPLTEAGQAYGKYWDVFFTTYNVTIPDDVTCWGITGASGSTGLIKLTKYSNKVLPANTAILYNATEPQVTFVPTANTSSTKPNTAYLKGAYCDSIMTDGTSLTYYVFRDGDQGLGFYHEPGAVVPGRTAFLSAVGKPESMPEAIVLADDVNPTKPIISAIADVKASNSNASRAAYNALGQRVNSKARGIVIVNGEKVIR